MKFQRKLINPFTGVDKGFDCDIRCDYCKNLPNYYVETSDIYGDYDETRFYCEKHQPQPQIPAITEEQKNEWNNFVNGLDNELTPEQREENEHLKANIDLMEMGVIC